MPELRARAAINAVEGLRLPLWIFGRFVMEAEMNNSESTSEKQHFSQPLCCVLSGATQAAARMLAVPVSSVLPLPSHLGVFIW